ncbi:hypothetical protein SAMN04488021_1647 [Paracoccus aminovorans]|uniref:Uncharacterized protein n=2 Tax=Paracoccus aminovorans TaxID=34004 RepID=A0A1I3F9B3_9RHOB|nr:hypothetical protein JCM7685_2799 [Paracoccus aminovorans]SFI07441.1 hypothetical protein SAMN04488021_1647 [Paracoccus aminovorans]
MIQAFHHSSHGATTFPTCLTPDLGLALVNLHLHGCADVAAARALHAIGLVAPASFSGPGPRGRRLAFAAVALEFQAHLEIGDILQGRAIRHRFVQEAFLRMDLDQFAGAEAVVFEHGYLERLSPEELAAAHRRSARGWRTD